jgi:hypothetical protein
VVDTFVIDSISYTLVGGTMRRTLWPISVKKTYQSGYWYYIPADSSSLILQDDYRLKWIEGMGSNKGFLYFLLSPYAMFEDYNSWTTCFMHSDTTLFANSVFLSPIYYPCDKTLDD